MFHSDDLLARGKHRPLQDLICNDTECHLTLQPVRSHGHWCCFVFKIPLMSCSHSKSNTSSLPTIQRVDKNIENKIDMKFHNATTQK